jgi:DNA-binding SARP family transcriptional activator
LRFDYRILGPVEVLRDGEPVRLGGRKQRTLLALLALQPGEPVAADGLIALLTGRTDEALAIFDDGLVQAEELGFRAGIFYVMEG